MPLLRSPEVMNRARAMGDYLRFKSVFPPRLSEFAILITARQWTQNYEWDAHYQLALRAACRRTSRAPSPRAPARAHGRRRGDPLQFCTELHQNKSVSDATYARIAKHSGAGHHRRDRHLRLLHASRHGPEYRTHAGPAGATPRSPHSRAECVSLFRSVPELNQTTFYQVASS
jgi:hypothetical protein